MATCLYTARQIKNPHEPVRCISFDKFSVSEIHFQSVWIYVAPFDKLGTAQIRNGLKSQLARTAYTPRQIKNPPDPTRCKSFDKFNVPEIHFQSVWIYIATFNKLWTTHTFYLKEKICINKKATLHSHLHKQAWLTWLLVRALEFHYFSKSSLQSLNTTINLFLYNRWLV